MPETLDEIWVAGALAGTPINVVRAKTVDLLVPAEAEIVVEGFIDTEYLEPEAPFGESHGYVGLQEYNAFMNVTAITQRRHTPSCTSFISQVTPSRSSVIRRVAMEPVLLDHLRTTLAIKSVKRVAMHEPLTSLYAVVGIQFARGTRIRNLARLDGASTLHRFVGKWIVAVDEDIDPHNADAAILGDVATAVSRSMICWSCRTSIRGMVRRGRTMMVVPAGADQRHAQEYLRSGRVAGARVHGRGEGDLGEARLAAAEAGKSMARL